MIKYILNTIVFHAARVMQDFPGLPFKVWAFLLRHKLRAAHVISKADEKKYED